MCSLYAFPKHCTIRRKKRALPNITYVYKFVWNAPENSFGSSNSHTFRKFSSNSTHTKKGLCDDGGVDIKCAVGLVSMCRWLPFKIIFMYFRVCLYTFRCNWTFANNFRVSRGVHTRLRPICNQTLFCCKSTFLILWFHFIDKMEMVGAINEYELNILCRLHPWARLRAFSSREQGPSRVTVYRLEIINVLSESERETHRALAIAMHTV